MNPAAVRRLAAALAAALAATLVATLLAAASAAAPPAPAATLADGGWQLRARSGEPVLELLDAEGRTLLTWDVQTLDGRQRSRIAAIQPSQPRRSFVVALQDVAELWEISLDPAAAPIYDGLVHDYRMGEALARPGYLGVRRTPLPRPLADLRIDPSGRVVMAVDAAPDGPPGVEVIHLDVRRVIARLPLAAPPDLDRLVFVDACARRWLGVPDRLGGPMRWFDARSWAPRAAAGAPQTDCAPAPQPPG